MVAGHMDDDDDNKRSRCFYKTISHCFFVVVIVTYVGRYSGKTIT